MKLFLKGGENKSFFFFMYLTRRVSLHVCYLLFAYLLFVVYLSLFPHMR